MSDSKNSRTIILTWLVNLSVSFLRLLFGTRMQIIFTIILYHLYVFKILSVSPSYKKNFPPMSSSPTISETFIFSHTHKHKRTHHQFFTFLVEKKERKIVSSSASKDLFRTLSVLRFKVQSHTSTLRVRKPAHDHVSSSSRAENRVAPPRCPALKDRSVTFDQRPRRVTWHGLVDDRLHVLRGKQCCLSTSRSEPRSIRLPESISKHGLTLRISDNPLLSGNV